MDGLIGVPRPIASHHLVGKYRLIDFIVQLYNAGNQCLWFSQTEKHQFCFLTIHSGSAVGFCQQFWPLPTSPLVFITLQLESSTIV